MSGINIISNGIYLPNKQIENKELSNRFDITEEYIFKRTGIEKRCIVDKEDILKLAINASKIAIDKLENKNIDLIIVATTTTNYLMPGISYLVQKELNIEKCMCLDILAGCNGYINAFDIAKSYIDIGKITTALIVGVDILSEYTNKDDIGTAIILSDGAGATIIEKSYREKIYDSYIISDGRDSDILTCKVNQKIYMNGKEVYKYAVTETVENIKELLKRNKERIDNIKYIVPHQSNIKIINSIASRLNIEEEKMYTNIKNVGNTFCASIPIALDEMMQKGLLIKGDKIILLGYGGGLNTGSILLEI